MSEAINIAITELEAVEREIGVPSKALPLLRAMRTTPGPASVAVTALRRIVDEGDYTAPEGMTRIAREALEQSSTAHEPRANTEGEVGLAADVGPGGGASASASGATHAPELSPALPPGNALLGAAQVRVQHYERALRKVREQCDCNGDLLGVTICDEALYSDSPTQPLVGEQP